MPVLRIQVTLPHENALPADAVTNTWHFNTDLDVPPGEGADALVIIDRLADFYKTDTSNGLNIAEFFANDYVVDAMHAKAYLLTDPEPRVPIAESDLSAFVDGETARQSSSDLPAEVAICMSYNRAFASGTPAARARGRLFLGPWNLGAASTVASPESVGVRPASSIRSTIALAATRLIAANDGTGEWWQWSPAANAGGVVVAGYIDNAWDTQRRRGVEPTARTGF